MTFTYETRENKDGSTTYSKTLNLGNDPVTGKRRQTRLSAKTVRELKRLWADAIGRVEDGGYIEPARTTFGEYLTHWLATYAKHNVRPTTYRSYEQLIRRHIIPELGRTPLQKLQPVQLQAFYNAKLAGGRADGNEGGLSPRTVRYLHTIIRESLHQAMKWQLVSRNVADMTEPPRSRRPQIATWDADQSRRFLDLCADDGYGAVWTLAITTGLRRGELLGLRWQDVDLAKKTLHVRRAVVEVGSALVIQEPKTSSGRRAVQLSPAAIAALREHRVRQNEHRLSIGPAWQDQDLVFATATGGPIAPRNLIRRFKELTQAANHELPEGDPRRLPTIRFHDLRHTHATILLKEGTHAKIVSERLGHANIGITLDTYSHVLPDMQREAAESIDRALFGS